MFSCNRRWVLRPDQAIVVPADAREADGEPGPITTGGDHGVRVVAVMPTAFVAVFTFQTAHLVPAARFPRPGFCTFASLTPNRGVGGAPRNVRVLGGTPVGRIMTRYARRLARRLASHDAAIHEPKSSNDLNETWRECPNSVPKQRSTQ